MSNPIKAHSYITCHSLHNTNYVQNPDNYISYILKQRNTYKTFQVAGKQNSCRHLEEQSIYVELQARDSQPHNYHWNCVRMKHFTRIKYTYALLNHLVSYDYYQQFYQLHLLIDLHLRKTMWKHAKNQRKNACLNVISKSVLRKTRFLYKFIEKITIYGPLNVT